MRRLTPLALFAQLTALVAAFARLTVGESHGSTAEQPPFSPGSAVIDETPAETRLNPVPATEGHDAGGARAGRPGSLRAHLRAPIVCFGYMATLVALAVGIDHAIAGRLFADSSAYVPAYRSFQDYDIGAKLNQFRGVEQQHFDGLMIGNSRTMFGVDPAAFDAALARDGVRLHSYNLAEESVDVRFWPPFFTRYYRRAPPRYLFLGVLPRDLDAHYTQGTTYLNAFFASAGFQNRNMSNVNRSAEEWLSKLFILHGRVSDTRLLSFSDILHGRKLHLNQARLANAQGWMTLPTSVLRTPKSFLRAQAKLLARRRGTLPFVLGGAQERSLIALNDWVRGGGGCLILYTTPLLYDNEPWGTIKMRQGFTSTMRRLVRIVPGLGFVDAGARVQRGYGVQDFGDGDHLNGLGAERFSAQLADALLPATRSGACRR